MRGFRFCVGAPASHLRYTAPMPGNRAWPIRWWLGSILALVALPLLALLTWIFGSQVRRERMEARETALRIARTTAARLRILHRDSLELLGRLAMRPAIRDFDGHTCDSLFAIIDFFPQYADLFLFDPNGRLLCSADPQPQDRQLSLMAERWIEGELRRGELQPGRPLIRSFGSQWVSILTVPVTGTDGARRGSLALVVLPEAVGAEALPPGAVLTIFDRNGTILTRSDDPEKWTGRNARSTAVVAAALRSKEGWTEARGLDGVSRQYGFTYIPEAGWYIYVGMRTSLVMQPVRQMIVAGVAGGVAILLSVVLAILVMSRSISRPINALARAADGAAQGEYASVAVAPGPLEIAEMGEAFNEMVESRSRGERNLKALSERLLVVQEQERTRIARELHDDLGQSLTALKMDVVGLLEKVGHSPVVRDRILRTLDSTVTAVQRISSELRPSVLDDLGLVAAIESEAHLFEERTGIECELSVPEDAAQVDAVCASAIYRIVQEALTNVARHSDASRVELRLRQRGDGVLLEVRDDGRGITADEQNDPSSLGLIGIRERAEIVGGTAHFEGIAGRGTIVSVRLPAAAPARSAS